ncbi:MAG: type I methionyl aminopeptidase [Planctomycetes bacterium]|nr:type I methionyl aminopeptidase [Planctomycetota bacterium]
MIFLKSPRELQRMRRACALTCRILRQMGEKVRPGATTREINDYALELCRQAGAKPLFLNYPGQNEDHPRFPGAICASPNHIVVHGIPNDVPLREGDILSIDFGCQFDGFCGDSAYTFPVGSITSEAQSLLDVTQEALRRGIQAAVPGNRVGDIAWAIQNYVESRGCGVVRPLVGHGIGRSMHEDPQVPNYGKPHEGDKLRVGMTLAIEPMTTQGHYDVVTLPDHWGVATKDGSLAAHFEHVVAVLSDGPEILTVEA